MSLGTLAYHNETVFVHYERQYGILGHQKLQKFENKIRKRIYDTANGF